MRDLLRLVRLPNTLSAMADVLAGAALAGVPILGEAAILAGIGSMLIYAGGVALGDVLDVEKDRALHPERPLPAGRISRRFAASVAVSLLLLGGATAFPACAQHVLTTLALLVAVTAYDVLSDRLRWSGPLLMGACRGLNMLRGLTLATPVSSDGWFAVGGYATLVAFVTIVSLAEDRPRRRWVTWCAGPIVLAWLIPSSLHPEPYLVPVLAIGGLAVGLFIVRPILATPPDPGSTVFRGVFGLVIFQALVVLAAGQTLLALTLAAFLPLMRSLAAMLGQQGS